MFKNNNLHLFLNKFKFLSFFKLSSRLFQSEQLLYNKDCLNFETEIKGNLRAEDLKL